MFTSTISSYFLNPQTNTSSMYTRSWRYLSTLANKIAEEMQGIHEFRIPYITFAMSSNLDVWRSVLTQLTRFVAYRPFEHHLITLFPWLCNVSRRLIPESARIAAPFICELRKEPPSKYKELFYEDFDALHTIEKNLISPFLPRSSTIARNVPGRNGRLWLTNGMLTPPSAARWTRQTNWLLLTIATGRRKHVSCLSPRISRRCLGSINILLLPLKLLLHCIDGPWRARLDIKSFGY